MTKSDDTFDPSPPIPEPDAPADQAEQQQAAAFGNLLERSERGTPVAAVELEQRKLLETAVALRAIAKPPILDDEAALALVAQALAERRNVVAADVGVAASATGATPNQVSSLDAARANRLPRWLPWAIAGTSTAVAAAAVTILLLRSQPLTPPAPLPLAWQSRPADAVIGKIDPAASGHAAARLDKIYADRMAGFRNARFAARGVTTRAHRSQP